MREYLMFAILMFVLPILILTAGLYAIDRELARQDYINGDWAEGCIFQSNCDFYNEKEIRDVEL